MKRASELIFADDVGDRGVIGDMGVFGDKGDMGELKPSEAEGVNGLGESAWSGSSAISSSRGDSRIFHWSVDFFLGQASTRVSGGEIRRVGIPS